MLRHNRLRSGVLPTSQSVLGVLVWSGLTSSSYTKFQNSKKIRKNFSNQKILYTFECVHLVNAIFLDCGQQLDRENDEAQAYLTGFLFAEIDKFLLSCSK